MNRDLITDKGLLREEGGSMEFGLLEMESRVSNVQQLNLW